MAKHEAKAMANNKRWATKQEAEEFIDKCFKDGNFGLSYCAACDFVGKEPVKSVNSAKEFCLGIHADCFMSYSDEQLISLINELKEEIYTAEYVETHKKYKNLDSSLESDEELLKVAIFEYKDRHCLKNYLDIKRYVSRMAHKKMKRALRRKKKMARKGMTTNGR